MSSLGKKTFRINDFSLGQASDVDPRSLRPNITPDSWDTTAQAQLCENFDISERGALITAFGYEQYSTLPEGEEPKYIGAYYYDEYRRHLLAVQNNNIYQIRKHILTSPSVTSGTFTNTRGGSAIPDPMSPARVSITPMDISEQDFFEMFVSISQMTDHATGTLIFFDNLEVRLETDASNYFYTQFTQTGFNNELLMSEAWETLGTKNMGLSWEIEDLDSVGSPDLTNITAISIVYNWTGDIKSHTVSWSSFAFCKRTETPTYKLIGTLISRATNGMIMGIDGFTGTAGVPIHLIFAEYSPPRTVRHAGAFMLDVANVSGAGSGHMAGCEMSNFLFLSRNNTIYYSAPENEGSWSTISVSGNVVALIPTVNKTVVAQLSTLNSVEISFNFDDATLRYYPVVNPYKVGCGGVAQKTVQNRQNDSISLTTNGVQNLADAEAFPSGNNRFLGLSSAIDKTLKYTNKEALKYSASFYNPETKQYAISVPLGVRQNTNNATFVYHGDYNYPAWTYRSGLGIVDSTYFREDSIFTTYFIGAENAIYRFTREYNYNGEPYQRRWISKIFNFNNPVLFKKLDYIEIGGSMTRTGSFNVIISNPDTGASEAFVIDSTSLLSSRIESDYIGDDVYGERFYGGDSLTDSPYTFYRFFNRIPLPATINFAKEFQIEIFQGTGDSKGLENPIKIDYIGGEYAVQSDKHIPRKHSTSSKTTLIR